MLALDPHTGRELWSFPAGDAILAAPALDRGILVFGSYDGKVHGLEALTGRPIWSYDAKAPVVSTPALHRGAAVVGTRGYDLVALGLRDGVLAWKRYIWMSWVESSASMMDDVTYVGSSDAAAVYAYHVPTGRLVWRTDVHGWAWGQPAATPARVYVGTSGQAGYPVEHRGELLALDLGRGDAVWRYPAARADSGAYGFPGSASTGFGRVFAAGLDGRVYAFAQ
jgi:outer membrane protein assembly factor BamB